MPHLARVSLRSARADTGLILWCSGLCGRYTWVAQATTWDYTLQMAPGRQYGKLTLEDFKALFLLLPQLDQERQELQAKIAERPEEFAEKFLTTGFTWAHLYEVPFPTLLAGFLAVSGVDQAVAHIAKQEAPVKAALALPETIQDMEWSGGTGGKFTPGDLLGYLHAVAGNLDCLLIYGCYLNDLIGRAKEGDMDSLFNAIRIDPSAVAGPTASFFISLSVVEGDKAFLEAVGQAMSGKTGRQASYLKKFRFLMQVLHEASELGRPTQELVELAFNVGAYARSPGAEKNVAELIRKAKVLKKNAILK